MNTLYHLSTDYSKLFQHLLAGHEAAGFITTKDYDDGDVVAIRRLAPWRIIMGSRGISHGDVFPFDAESGKSEEEVFAGACRGCGLRWIDPSNDHLIADLKKMQATLIGLAGDIEDLIGESYGVSGLHLNGDVAPWGELEPGGRFERLTHLADARVYVMAVAELEAAEKAQEAADHQRDIEEGR